MVNEGFGENRSAKQNVHPYQPFQITPANGEIRDILPHVSDVVCLRGLVRGLIDLNNTLNKTAVVLIHVAHKRNMERLFLLKTITLAAGIRQIETLGDPWGFVRLTVTASVQPTTGAMFMEFEGADC
jgi:hypothetical protein